ncbi:uncharacterized protein LOC62_01G001072 [Vanrija pseudolonga]|uniref:Uncharacterized protein n=1 Tax=Vanrija pseudolonga TaxID=143232 RepID=A0AAF0Y062_9TREE|nr:hypothetical protein LOC62_01G001072 [Vanrija pseudolonga]
MNTTTPLPDTDSSPSTGEMLAIGLTGAGLFLTMAVAYLFVVLPRSRGWGVCCRRRRERPEATLRRSASTATLPAYAPSAASHELSLLGGTHDSLDEHDWDDLSRVEEAHVRAPL